MEERKEAACEPNYNISGRVTALSHIFRNRNGPMLCIEIEKKTEKNFIIVRRPRFLKWQKQIIIGSFYVIKNLKRDLIYKNSHRIRVYIPSHRSKLSITRQEHPSFMSEGEIDNSLTFVSIKGKVTEIVDEELGIYKLEGNIIVIISYLKNVTVEWRGRDDSYFNEKSMDLACFVIDIKVGDEVTIFNGHPVKRNDGSTAVFCCGRSFVKCIKNNLDEYKEYQGTNSGILHCLHTFNYGMAFFYWLLSVQECLLICNESDESNEKITRREWGKGRGSLYAFVEEILKDWTPNGRSLLQEFFLDEHSCVIFKGFEHATPLKLTEVGRCLRNHRYPELSSNLNETLWDFRALSKHEHNWILLGRLETHRRGSLVMRCKEKELIVVVMGPTDHLYELIGCTVSISNFHYIEELFNVYEGKFSFEYIIVHSKYILSGGKRSRLSSVVDTREEVSQITVKRRYYSYELKISSLSGLNFFVSDMTKEKFNGYFVANSFICFKDGKFNEENWKAVIRFKGDLSLLYPLLMEPCIISGRAPVEDRSETYFRKKHYFSILRSFQEQLGTCECVDAPTEFIIDSISSRLNFSALSSDSVKDIFDGGSLNSKVFSIEGVILKKWLMSPKFESEAVEVPIELVREGISSPGRKVISILLQDKSDPRFQIWVYLSSGNQFYVPEYHFGLVPGSGVCISWLERSVSRNGKVYLSGSHLTRVTITNFAVSSEQNLPLKHCFISELKRFPSGSSGLIFATVSLILNITLKKICPSCESDIVNGICSYIGCHVNLPGIIAGSAKVVLDDGTETASLFIKNVDEIKVLLAITNTGWDALIKYTEKAALNYRFRSYGGDGNRTDVENAFRKLVEHPQLRRPLKIICRIFAKKETPLEEGKLDLFCLKLALVNPIGDAPLLRKP